MYWLGTGSWDSILELLCVNCLIHLFKVFPVIWGVKVVAWIKTRWRPWVMWLPAVWSNEEAETFLTSTWNQQKRLPSCFPSFDRRLELVSSSSSALMAASGELSPPAVNLQQQLIFTQQEALRQVLLFMILWKISKLQKPEPSGVMWWKWLQSSHQIRF